MNDGGLDGPRPVDLVPDLNRIEPDLDRLEVQLISGPNGVCRTFRGRPD
jgi:hypothetical protein